jgi:hypothetical protein
MVETGSCQAVRLGVVLKGTIKVVHDDSSGITFSAGEAYTFSPENDAGVIGD